MLSNFQLFDLQNRRFFSSITILEAFRTIVHLPCHRSLSLCYKSLSLQHRPRPPFLKTSISYMFSVAYFAKAMRGKRRSDIHILGGLAKLGLKRSTNPCRIARTPLRPWAAGLCLQFKRIRARSSRAIKPQFLFWGPLPLIEIKMSLMLNLFIL